MGTIYEDFDWIRSKSRNKNGGHQKKLGMRSNGSKQLRARDGNHFLDHAGKEFPTFLCVFSLCSYKIDLLHDEKALT